MLCASGLLSAMIEHEAATAFMDKIAGAQASEVTRVCGRLAADCIERMREEGVPAEAVHTSYFADVCYVGQAHHIEVPLQLERPDTMLSEVYESFCALHDQVYGHSTRSPARFVNLRVVQRAANDVSAPVAGAPSVRQRHAKAPARSCCRGAMTTSMPRCSTATRWFRADDLGPGDRRAERYDDLDRAGLAC